MSSVEKAEWQSALEAKFVPCGVDAALIAALVSEEDQSFEAVHGILEALGKSTFDDEGARHDTPTVPLPTNATQDGEGDIERLLEEWKLVDKDSNLAENLAVTDEEEEAGDESQSAQGEREANRVEEADSRGLVDIDGVAAGREDLTGPVDGYDQPNSGLAFLIHAFPSRTPIFLQEMIRDEGGIVENVIDNLMVMEMVENGEMDGGGGDEEDTGDEEKGRGLNYDVLERGTGRKKTSKNDRRRRREQEGGANNGRAAQQTVNLTDIRRGVPPSSYSVRKPRVGRSISRPAAHSEPEDDAAMAIRLDAEERAAAGLAPQDGTDGAAVQDNDWLFSSSILDQLSVLLDLPSHKVRSVHNSTHFNLRASTQRLINLNCLDFPSLASLDEVGKAPSGTAATIVDGLAILAPSKSRSDVERAFRGTRGRQDATLDLLQLVDVVEQSAAGEKTDILDPMKASRSSTAQVSTDAQTQEVGALRGHFAFVGQEEEPSLAPGQVPYAQITKRSMRGIGGTATSANSASRQHALDLLKAGAASTSYPFHSAHIDAATSMASSSSSTLFEGAKRHETQSEAQRLAVEYRSVAQEYRARRERSLFQAAQAYRSLPGGANKQLKGAAAWVYADEARRLDAKARAFSLKAAQATVQHRMLTNRAHLGTTGSQSSDVVDLHGLTVHESLSITKEALSAWWARSSSGNVRPLYIVTGVGRHSRGNVAVIRPAILKMLQREGWVVDERREGQLAVRGLH